MRLMARLSTPTLPSTQKSNTRITGDPGQGRMSHPSWCDLLCGGALVVQGEEPFENFCVSEGRGPAIGSGYGFVQGVVDVAEPGGALVVKIGEGTGLEFGLGSARRV